MLRVLFVCSQNKLRSPTAEQVFSGYRGIEVASAGLNAGAEVRLSAEMVRWADVIFVMEPRHAQKLRRAYREHLNGQRVVCLGIPDDFAYMEPALVQRLEAQVPRHLHAPASTRISPRR